MTARNTERGPQSRLRGNFSSRSASVLVMKERKAEEEG